MKILEEIKKDIRNLIFSFKNNFLNDKKKILINLYINLFVLYILLCIFSNYYLYSGDFSTKVFKSIFNSKDFTFNPVINIENLKVSLIFLFLINILIYIKRKKRKNFKEKGTEYGSAKWGTKKDILPFISEKEENNILLTETEKLSMDIIPKNPKYSVNKNIAVVGSSGSGKTRFFVKPNLMQLNSSYVVTDTKGTVIEDTGKLFSRNKYKIKIFNLIDLKKSMHFNPFSYLKSESDIIKFVNILIKNTKGEGEKSGEEFWIKAEMMLFSSVISYMFSELEKEEHTFDSVNKIVRNALSEKGQSVYELMIEELEQKNPEHFAVEQYHSFISGAKETKQSIVISCLARLHLFTIEEVKNLTAYDEIELEKIGDRKTILYILIKDTDSTFYFLSAIMYSLLFDILCDRALEKYNGTLPVQVTCLLDEFANMGMIPSFENLIAVIRSRGINAIIFLQSLAQLEAIYNKKARIILDNCDSLLFLGSNSKETCKEISEMLGNETIDMYDENDTRGTHRSYGINYKKISRNLMTPDEVRRMSSDKCILFLRGVSPFLSKKYNIKRHKNYKFLNEKINNKFNIGRFLKIYRNDVILDEESIIELFEV